jgi:hypothetical protein
MILRLPFIIFKNIKLKSKFLYLSTLHKNIKIN